MPKIETTRKLHRQINIAILCIILAHLLIFTIFSYLIDRQSNLMVKRYYLIWPSILLAQFGYSHTWIISFLLLPIYSVSLIYFTITQRLKLMLWKRLLIIPIVAVLYFTLAWISIDCVPNPLPDKTPYDSVLKQRKIYLKHWDCGFQVGKMGCWRTFGLGGGTPIEMGGHYNGMMTGHKSFNRTFGDESTPDIIPQFCFKVLYGK